MPCINPDGTLLRSGELLLLALRSSITLAEAAKETGMPLFRVRSGVRELMHLGYVTEKDGAYSTTQIGIMKLEGHS